MIVKYLGDRQLLIIFLETLSHSYKQGVNVNPLASLAALIRVGMFLFYLQMVMSRHSFYQYKA